VPWLAAVGVACTLSPDYQPARLETTPVLPVDPGPTASACAESAECCDAVPCASGLSCNAGACQQPLPSPEAGGCRGSECPLPETIVPPPAASTCDDGAVGTGETDTDCGGVCGSNCDVGQLCARETDCVSGLLCAPGVGRCASPSCADGLQDGTELATDCGGSDCPGCADGSACNVNSDCLSGFCAEAGRCAAPSCTDGARNGDETGVDCGGPCPSCPTGDACSAANDCQSGVCGGAGCAAGVASCCQAATCTDSVSNANESDVDCGGRCPDCATGRTCDGNGDCQSQVCAAGGCGAGVARCCQAPSCDDDTRNADEVDVDCGGSCNPCALGAQCGADTDCASGFCDGALCADPGTCSDGARNGRESAVDCGGDRCGVCPDRATCNQASDCFNNNCFEGICISCGSGVLDGTETGIDCGGDDPFCRRCNPGERCLINSDCTTGFCNNGFC
jgi:hypothetical protein